MRKLNGYDKAKAYTESERLPVGGYVCKILNVEYQANDRLGYSDQIVLSFDIAEGDYKGFYMDNYKSQDSEDKKWKGTYRIYVPKDDGSEKDGWTMRKFKTDMVAFELSNENYAWDWNEQSLKGKLVGIVFQNKEYSYNGKTGFFTSAHHLASVEQIHSGKFKIPADKLLDKPSSSSGGADWMNVPDNVDSDELPFN